MVAEGAIMADMTPSSDFYEDDEPVEKIKAAFERGIKGVTARPRGRTEYLSVGQGTSFSRANEPAGHAINR
jgi:hypothetical protein